MADDIPTWAINEALKRCGVSPDCAVFSDWRNATYAKAVRLFAAHIAEHEEPPVDPFEAELERIAEEVVDLWRASGGGQFVCKNFALAALRRGMELAREQSK